MQLKDTLKHETRVYNWLVYMHIDRSNRDLNDKDYFWMLNPQSNKILHSTDFP